MSVAHHRCNPRSIDPLSLQIILRAHVRSHVSVRLDLSDRLYSPVKLQELAHACLLLRKGCLYFGKSA